MPVSMALVADLYPPAKRTLPLGIVGAVDTAGWVLGHLYGGIMVQFMTWPYLFWINLPIVVVSGSDRRATTLTDAELAPGAWLTKPVKPRALVALVRELADGERG